MTYHSPPYKNGAPATRAEGATQNSERTRLAHVNNAAEWFDYESVDKALLAEPQELVPFMQERDVLSWQVKRAALLALLGLEPRPFAKVAESLGVTRQALDVAYTRLCDRLGWEPMFRRIETRKKNAARAMEAAQRRKAA